LLLWDMGILRRLDFAQECHSKSPRQARVIA
jgi:hypothetical protein